MSVIRKLFLVLLVLSIPYAAFADDLTPKKEQHIRDLLQLTDAANLGNQVSQMVMDQMSKALSALQPDASSRVMKIVQEEVSATISDNLPSFTNHMVPLYADHFTDKEIRQLIKFYKTDVGKKTIAVLPALLQDSMEAGQKWGESLAPVLTERLQKRLESEGFDLNMEAAPIAPPRQPMPKPKKT